MQDGVPGSGLIDGPHSSILRSTPVRESAMLPEFQTNRPHVQGSIGASVFMANSDSVPEKLTVIVTGASSGLGVETARALSAAGAEVLLVARDQIKLQAVAEDLRQQKPGAQLHTQCMDLADIDSVRAAAAQLRPRLGAGGCRRRVCGGADG